MVQISCYLPQLSVCLLSPDLLLFSHYLHYVNTMAYFTLLGEVSDLPGTPGYIPFSD